MKRTKSHKDFCHPLKGMESLAEGIREEVDNAARTEILADRIAYLIRTASMCKKLRTKCNRELMELERINIHERNT
jgi:hypothetical protein